jgi:hypothetical protein
MFKQEMVRQDFESSTDGFAILAGCGHESSLLLAIRDARISETGAQEDAVIETQGILAQADEALVMG